MGAGMNWFITIGSSSIGKKMLMALTGLFFCVFLFTHLIGNLMIYGGKTAFNTYSVKLHTLGFLINIIEMGLLLCAIVHVSLGIILYYQNWRARPVGYVKNKNAGGRTLSSATMPYTGLYLLIFVIIHLINFHFSNRTEDGGIYQVVSSMFSNPAYAVYYLFSMIVAAFHIKHGIWSAFQTLGINHPKYMPLIKNVSFMFSIITAIGFGSIPLFLVILAQ
jgi:succinate dehydrogenase / fumarate reductase cytochrome b subunit